MRRCPRQPRLGDQAVGDRLRKQTDGFMGTGCVSHLGPSHHTPVNSWQQKGAVACGPREKGGRGLGPAPHWCVRGPVPTCGSPCASPAEQSQYEEIFVLSRFWGLRTAVSVGQKPDLLLGLERLPLCPASVPRTVGDQESGEGAGPAFSLGLADPGSGSFFGMRVFSRSS